MRVVAVASGKGGVGKSTVGLGPARALAARGASVGVIDLKPLTPLRFAPLSWSRCARVRAHLRHRAPSRRAGSGRARRSDARRTRQLFAMSSVLLGAVENMSGFRCPHCGEAIDVLGRVADERSVLRELDLLVRIPLDPAYGHVNGIAPVFVELVERVVGKLA